MCNDILQVAFNRKFINEIFTHHQPIYSKKVLKAMFERLAHASTIRVTPESLDKVSFFVFLRWLNPHWHELYESKTSAHL